MAGARAGVGLDHRARAAAHRRTAARIRRRRVVLRRHAAPSRVRDGQVVHNADPRRRGVPAHPLRRPRSCALGVTVLRGFPARVPRLPPPIAGSRSRSTESKSRPLAPASDVRRPLHGVPHRGTVARGQPAGRCRRALAAVRLSTHDTPIGLPRRPTRRSPVRGWRAIEAERRSRGSAAIGSPYATPNPLTPDRLGITRVSGVRGRAVCAVSRYFRTMPRICGRRSEGPRCACNASMPSSVERLGSALWPLAISSLANRFLPDGHGRLSTTTCGSTRPTIRARTHRQSWTSAPCCSSNCAPSD